jgi:hypothetical protein
MPAPKTTAAKAEALASGVAFTYDGDSYTISPTSEWDLDALDAYEEGHVSKCVRLILGEDQWQLFRSKRRTVGDLNDLFEVAQKAAGIEGN